MVAILSQPQCIKEPVLYIPVSPVFFFVFFLYTTRVTRVVDWSDGLIYKSYLKLSSIKILYSTKYQVTLTLNMLDCFKDYKRCIHILYHMLDSVQQKKSKSQWSMMSSIQYHSCWSLVPWRLKEPGHQQVWHWPNKLEYSISSIRRVNFTYISHASVGNKIVDHSDVVGASPVCAAPTTSSFSA